MPLEIVHRREEMVQLEQEKPGSQRGFDSCNLAGCLARGATDVLSTWSQEDSYRKGKPVSLFFWDLEELNTPVLISEIHNLFK